jgi:hypothetical protein
MKFEALHRTADGYRKAGGRATVHPETVYALIFDLHEGTLAEAILALVKALDSRYAPPTEE